MGNERTRDSYVRRHMRYPEGDLFSEKRLEADIRRLNNAEVMQAIDLKKDVDVTFNDAELKVDILIRMKERK